MQQYYPKTCKQTRRVKLFELPFNEYKLEHVDTESVSKMFAVQQILPMNTDNGQ